MKVAVMGAGSVGCFFGGMLARAGHEVVLIGRPSHVEAVRRAGLRMQTRDFDETLRLEADTGASAAAGASLVLFSVKSTATESAGAELLPHLAPGALLLCLQNGVDNAARLRQVIPAARATVAASVVYVATEMAGPGHVLHHGRGELLIEPAAGSEAAAQAFTAAGVPSEVSPDVRGALWSKLILNCAYNAASALTRLPYGALLSSAGVPQLMQDVVEECRAVARAEGVTLPGDPLKAVLGLAATMSGQYSSTAQDVMRGKPSEIDHLNGLVVRLGERHGIATPVNRVLHALVHAIDTHRPASSPSPGARP